MSTWEGGAHGREEQHGRRRHKESPSFIPLFATQWTGPMFHPLYTMGRVD